jgi:cobalt-zinc-cadmium efflux system outer membrane protein
VISTLAVHEPGALRRGGSDSVMHRRTLRVRPLVVWLAVVAALASQSGADDDVAPRPLGREHPVLSAPRDPEEPLAINAPVAGEIALADAIAAALRSSPALGAVAYEVRSREALAIQAAARPNPDLAVEVEDFAGSGSRDGFDSAETTLSLAQLIELGGDRSRRMRVAELDTALASWDFEADRLAVLSDAAKTFVVLLAVQERQALAAELERLAGETLRSVSSTVRAGAVSPVEEQRASVNLERVQLDLVREARALEVARAQLAATWGDPTPQFTRALGALDALPPTPDLARLEAAVSDSPELARWNAEIAQREAALALERARRIPDVTVSLGGRYYSDGDDGGLVAGASVPLPLFDRNRGGVLDARHRVARARAEQRLADVSVRAALRARYQELLAAGEEVAALRDRIIPHAERVFLETRRGYATGLFRHVEVLDAQRTLFDARRELLDAWTAFHLAATDLERITGVPLAELAGRATP